MSRTPAPPPGRATVHAASGGRLGTAHPRQEGPTDLRLVPPALAAWATAALMLDATSGWVAGVAVLCLTAAVILLAVRRRGGRAGSPTPTPTQTPTPTPMPGPWPRASVAALLLCVAAAAVSAGLHGADLRRGPVPGLARQYATVTAEVEITSDPRLTRPRIRGDHAAPASVVMEGRCGGSRKRTGRWWRREHRSW